MTKTGLFGGAFNPPHNGHIAVARAAMDAGLDRVVFIPSGRAPHKPYEQDMAQHRFRMTYEAVAHMKGADVSRYELDRGEVSYSADTVAYFSRAFPSDELFFIVGDDSYGDFKSWREPARIFAKATVLVFPRLGLRIGEPARMIEMEKVEISSEDIRKKIKNGEDVSNLLPKAVFEYIMENNLYRQGNAD